MGAQEPPRLVGPQVGQLGAHVAAPEHECAGRLEWCGQSRRLRVVEQDNVAGTDPCRDALEVGGLDRCIHGGFLLTELPVARHAVQSIVYALGDREERRLAGDHVQPAGVHAHAADVTHEYVEHLGHSAARSSRIDVPHRGAVQGVACGPPRP